MNASHEAPQPAPGAADAAAAPELDPQQIAMLSGLRKGELLPLLLRTYRDQLPQQLADMTAAAAAADVARLGGIAHSLKSSSYSIGATRMGDLCAALETAARRGDNADGPRRCTELAAAWERLRPELEGYLAP
jgi:HPt (histidine-containing phosphotransfer) domain-containing protein